MEYWRRQLQGDCKDWVHYGNDVVGTAFSPHPDDPLGSTAWNLNVSTPAFTLPSP